MTPNRTKTIVVALFILIVIALGGFAYWYFFMGGAQTLSPDTTTPNGTNTPSGFQPFGRPSTNTSGNTGTQNQNNNTQTEIPDTAVTIPALRLLSNTPVGGYGASTTASTTVIRWVDRGRGNIYEAVGDKLDITTLSNTLVPRIYDSIWNKNLTAFISSTLSDNEPQPNTLYAELLKRNLASSTNENLTPFELRGKNMPNNIVSYAVSPKSDSVFLFTVENARGKGYITPFNGGTLTQIFDTPITQVNIEWPEANNIAITTKGSIATPGFLYFVNPKTGIWKKIVGPVFGLSTKVSRDAKYVLLSAPDGAESIVSSIYNISTGKGSNAVIKTLADKCAWGNFYKNILYCAVPAEQTKASYPDDWYKGIVSFIDKIWQINADTGEIHLVTPIVDQSDRVIDAINLGLDTKDDYLIFMNKNDLSLWSFDLVKH